MKLITCIYYLKSMNAQLLHWMCVQGFKRIGPLLTLAGYKAQPSGHDTEKYMCTHSPMKIVKKDVKPDQPLSESKCMIRPLILTRVYGS